jgi:DNA polymerase III, beta subunit
MPGVIVPRKTITELVKLTEEAGGQVQISLSDTKIKFVCGSVVLVSKLIDGTFPDYDRVIPTGNDKIMEVEGKRLAQAVDRVSVIASEKSRGIKLLLEESSITLSATSAEQGSADEQLEVKYSADSVEIGFNSRYLLDVLGQIESDSVQFVFADSQSPALIRDPADLGALYVVMPMRV